MGISDIVIEKAPNGSYLLKYSADEVVSYCTPNEECFTDKTEIRSILISVIKNFNEANPKFSIPVEMIV